MAVAYSIENHPADSRVNIDDSGKVQTLTSRMGTGGGNVPMVMEPVAQLASGKEVAGCLMASGYEKLGAQEMFSGDYTVIEKQPVYCLQGNGIDRADTAGCNGKGWKEDTSYTLNTIDRPAVAYGVETFHCNTEEEKVPTLKARDWKDPNVVCYETPIAIDRAFFNQGQNAKYDPQYYTDGTNPTLVARGPSAVAVRYIVRRLTPTECARLQGFADRWGDIDEKTEFSDEEYNFWLEVRNTHATVIGGREAKDYTKAQMLKWYNSLHTDSAEYKMWGNGIALPPALYCMQGMAEALRRSV
jgi:DNA (cytosine-5)-methyltransferase 1